MMNCRAWLPILILPAVLSLAACNRQPAAVPTPKIDWSDPDVGGGVGMEVGPETLVPPTAPVKDQSPRLDAAAVATADSHPPTPVPTAAPTIESPTPQPAVPTATAEPESSTTIEGESNEAGETIHIVQPGENLYQIGLLYGLSWVTIAEYNGIADPDAIAVGQEIRIPGDE